MRTVASCLATLITWWLAMMVNSCHGNGYEPASRLMVLRDLPKGLDINQPQHLIIRTSYSGSVELIEASEFSVEVNITSPSIAELSRVHYNFTDYHGSILLQLFDVNVKDVAGMSMTFDYIIMLLGGIGTLAFSASLVFVCWWNACKRTDTLHVENKTQTGPDSSQAPLLDDRQQMANNQLQNSTGKLKKPAQQKSLHQMAATDESCVSSEDDLNDDSHRTATMPGATRIRRPLDGGPGGATLRTAGGIVGNHRSRAGLVLDGGRSADRLTELEVMTGLPNSVVGSIDAVRVGAGSPARSSSDCPSEDRSGSVSGATISCVRMDSNSVDGGCNTTGGRRSAQYIQLNAGNRPTGNNFPTGDKYATISGGNGGLPLKSALASGSTRLRRDNSVSTTSGSGASETTIPDVVRTRCQQQPSGPPPPAEFSDTDYSTISRNLTGSKVVQLVSDSVSPPHSQSGSSVSSTQKPSSDQRSVTFSPSVKQSPDDTTVYDTFGKPRRHNGDLTGSLGEPRYVTVTSSMGRGGNGRTNDGRVSPSGGPDRRSTLSDGSGRMIDEAYGTLGSSSCSTLASGGTASSGSSGSVVTVIAAGGSGGLETAGGSLTRRQHVASVKSEAGGTLPSTRKGGNQPRLQKFLQTSLLGCITVICVLNTACNVVQSQQVNPETIVHIKVYAPANFLRDKPEVFARRDRHVDVISNIQSNGGLHVDKYEVAEPRITDLRVDKCRGVPCQQSCDAGVGTCICHDGYRLSGTRCEDIDECKQSEPVCHEFAKCYNQPGSFRCICMDGFYGDGINCKSCSTPCENGTYEVMQCSSSHPKLCRECSKTCMEGYYISADCRPTNDTVCKPCRAKCGRYDYEYTPCVGSQERQCREIKALALPIPSQNMIMEDRHRLSQVNSIMVHQDSRTSQPLTYTLMMKRGTGFVVNVTIKEANLAPMVRAVNHSESNDNEGFFDEIKITQEYCAYPLPEKYQLSVVLHQGITTKAQFYNCGSTAKKRKKRATADKRCILETGYYLNPREPCETYSKFGRIPPLNEAGWSVLCVAPGRLTDAFGVSSELTDMTTMFVDRTVKCAEQRTNCDACTVNCARTMQSYKGSNRCNITADDADNGESPRLAYCFSCCNKQECSKLCEVYHNKECQQLRCITGNLAEFVLSPIFPTHRSTIFACHVEPVPRYKIYDIEYKVLHNGQVVNNRSLTAQRLFDSRTGHPESAVDSHNFLKIYFGSKITTKPDLIEGDSLMKSFIAGYYQAKGQELASSSEFININTRSLFVRPKSPFGVSSKTWKRESCDTDVLSRLTNATGSPPESDPFKPEPQLEVQFVSRGTYRLFNKTYSEMPFIWFELGRDVSLLRNSGVYDPTTVRDDNTLRADLIRSNQSTWVLHINGELLRCPGAFSVVVRDPGYPNQPLFDIDVGVACPTTFSLDFTIPTEGPDNYDKTLLVDLTDSYRTIKMTIFRPAPNLTAAAHEFFNSNKSYDGPVTYTNAGEIRITIFSPFVGFIGAIVGFLGILLFIGFIADTDKGLGHKTETRIGLQHMFFVVCYVTFRVVYSVAVTFTILVLLLRYFNRSSMVTLSQFGNYVETAGNSQRLDIEHIQNYVIEELQRQNNVANVTKQNCEQKLIQLQNQLEEAKQQIRVDNHDDRLVSQVAQQYTKMMVLNLTNNINKFKQEFTAYAQKALDRLTRSIVQTSSAIQGSKWLAGAKVIYDVVQAKRREQNLPTKPFMEWAGLDHEVDRLVADLSLKDFPVPNLTEFLNIDIPKLVKKPTPIPKASDVVLPRNQWYYQPEKKPSPPPAGDIPSSSGNKDANGKLAGGDVVGATTLLAVLVAIDFLWFIHRMARTYTTARMVLYGCPIYIACKRSDGDGSDEKMCITRCFNFIKKLNLRVMKTEFIPKLVATITVLCALYVVLAASDKLVTVKSLASIGYFDALVAPVETSYRLARTRVKMNAQRINRFELPFYEELVNVRAKRYQLLLDMYAEVQRSAAIVHDSEYCAWQRLLKPDELCNCTSVHVARLSFDGCELPPVLPLPYMRKEFSLHRDRLSRTIVPYVNSARHVVMDTCYIVFIFVTVLVVIDTFGAVLWIYMKRFNMLKLKPLYEIEQLPAVPESNHR